MDVQCYVLNSNQNDITEILFNDWSTAIRARKDVKKKQQ